MQNNMTTEELKTAIAGKLHHHFGRTVADATTVQLFRACALVMRDIMSHFLINHANQETPPDTRQVHYLSLEFLLGRSLMKNAFNLGLLNNLKDALASFNVDPTEVFETEPDPGLGNGGLGRLAACYIDSMTTLDIPATGYSMCYEFGIFRQKIIDGCQIEMPDDWKDVGDVWLIPRLDEIEEVRFGGVVDQQWENGKLRIDHRDYVTVKAVPMDMPISGYNTNHVNLLRLWDAKSPTPIDLGLFSRGEYMKAVEQHAMAELITKVLYPDDNHFEGKSLRLKQQYFFVSATVQNIVRRHKKKKPSFGSFHLEHVIHINDTHPALVIPELMRILLDQEGYSWDTAWYIVTHSVAYTNHTVMAEALERWPQQLFIMLLPRVWDILCEINRWYIENLQVRYPHDQEKISKMAIVWDGEVRMANLCAAVCYAINGVSELHSNLLRTNVFKDVYDSHPSKFHNVTNGIDHRRWLAQINPGLHDMITELIGDRYLVEPSQLQRLDEFAGDESVLMNLAAIKRRNKRRMADYIFKNAGVLVDPDSMFDVQVKRLHEYKRQMLNVFHVIHLYNLIRDNPSIEMRPRTVIFGAKAAPGYHTAKRIIQLICCVAEQINSDPIVADRLKVVFLENYCVSQAEVLMPASELSEQISLASTEASGTGNMKFMINGALTIGTLDGANIEIAERAGDDNAFIFGLHAEDVLLLQRDQSYIPSQYYNKNADLRRIVDEMASGFSGKAFQDLVDGLLIGANAPPDRYFLLADFDSYCDAHLRAEKHYADLIAWNRSSLANIAGAGHFAADRSIEQYKKYIWKN